MKTLIKNFLFFIIIFLIISGLFSLFISENTSNKEITLDQFVSFLQNDQIKELVVDKNKLNILLVDGQEKFAFKEESETLGDVFKNYNIPSEKVEKIKIKIKPPASNFLLNIVPLLSGVALMIFFFIFLNKQLQKGGVQAMKFGESGVREISPEEQKNKVTFKDVAGVKEAKEELKEIVDFLKKPEKFIKLGAKIPKGVLLIGAPGVGKCVTGDSLVSTNKGIIKIDEIPKYFNVNKDFTVDGLEVVSFDYLKNKSQIVKASHWYDLGFQKTKIVETDAGMNIKGTFEHPIMVVDQLTGNFVFKRLDEIKKDDWLVSGINSSVFGNYTKLPHPDVAYLLGVLVGDGCSTIKNRIYFSSADQEIVKRTRKIAKKYLGKEFKKTGSRPYDYMMADILAKQKLIDWGLLETYAENKKIPEWVRIAPKKFVINFLQGLFDTDGTAEKRGSISLSSSSEQLIKEVFVALLNLGIVSRQYQRKKKYNGKYQFYLQIYGDFIEAFQQKIGFRVKRKKINLAKTCKKQRNTNINLIPYQQQKIKNLWTSAVKTTGCNLNRAFYEQSLYKNIRRYISGERIPSPIGVGVMIKEIQTISPSVSQSPEIAFLKNISNGEFFFTKVKNIKEGFGCVYDLTVPRLHNFLANGLINHNTLLAKAVAGEANVPFFHISGSEFIELFVGIGASRVRDAFKKAKKNVPSILFIDELDAIGRLRGAGLGGSHDEREQTLNQILVELDGFEPNIGLVVMSATNRPDVLDPALLRPGRFDRKVILDMPDVKDREEILKIHSRGKPLSPDVKIEEVSQRTPGFTGADLANLMNEAAILAAVRNKNQITQIELLESIEKVILGPERKSFILGEKEKKVIAFHETGHAVVTYNLSGSGEVRKISIIARGKAAGYTIKAPKETKYLFSRTEIINELTSLLGGYAAEKIFFNEVTSGAAEDLKDVAKIARKAVIKYGMSEVLGPRTFGKEEELIFLGKEFTGEKDYSEKTAQLIDKEISKIIDFCYNKAIEIIKRNKKKIGEIANYLIKKETIEKEEFEKLMI